MANRYGTVLVFKEGAEKDKITAALNKLADEGLLEGYWLPEDPELRKMGVRWPYRLERYDDRLGGPVWYIP